MIVYLQTILIVNFWIYIITKTDSMLAFSADLYMPDNLRLLQSWVFLFKLKFLFISQLPKRKNDLIATVNTKRKVVGFKL
jgi:hypothetical protein